MNIKTKKLLRHLCMFSGLMLTGNMAHAACSVSASGTSSISVPSIYLMENGENSSQFNSSLSCTGYFFNMFRFFAIGHSGRIFINIGHPLFLSFSCLYFI